MFAGLNTALTSLYAQRAALETTGNNMANVNTEGYSRQRVQMTAIDGNQYASFFSTGARAGSGVSIQDITRLRDQFLETRGLQEHANQSQLQAGSSVMETIELAFGEPGETGLQSQLAEFWSAWDKVANRPDDEAARAQVIEQAKTVVAVFGQTASSLAQLQTSSTANMKSNINTLNSLAQNVADLNQAIKNATGAGVNANDLLDKRDLLVNQMSKIAGVTVQKTDQGSVAVNIGGTSIVRDERVTRLQVDDSSIPVVLRWDGDNDANTTSEGTAAAVTGGTLGGLLTAVNATIPKYRTQLDAVAASLITTVNTQHALGLDRNGTAGGPFFTGTNASDIAVDPTLAADSKLLAAADSTGGELDGENARTMANFASKQSGPDATYRSLIDLLGVEAQRSYNQVDIQTNITNSIDAARQSVSGVSLDEEMTNMLMYQKAYSAAAQYLSTINSTLDSLLSIVR